MCVCAIMGIWLCFCVCLCVCAVWLDVYLCLHVCVLGAMGRTKLSKFRFVHCVNWEKLTSLVGQSSFTGTEFSEQSGAWISAPTSPLLWCPGEKNNLAGKGDILEGLEAHSVSPLPCRKLPIESTLKTTQCSLMLSKGPDSREVHGTLLPTEVCILPRLQGPPSLTGPRGLEQARAAVCLPLLFWPCHHLMALDSLLPPVASLQKNTGRV